MANHRILARLPIHTYWTTNYDKLIEKALEEAKKVPDVKHEMRQLSVTRRDRDVSVYKMHGDVDHPADAIICKDDYEAYPLTMSAFVSALRRRPCREDFPLPGLLALPIQTLTTFSVGCACSMRSISVITTASRRR